MAWRGSLAIDYRQRDGRTIVHDRHDGPLRVLRSLHPEGGVCHSVLVHPPGGVVGGDELAIELTLGEGAHALVTTPGATRFYRSAGADGDADAARGRRRGSRLEWLPLETIAYSGCVASNALRFELAADAEMIGWDVTALGLPESDRPFDAGRFTQSIELPGRWLERGDDRRRRRRACSIRRSAGPAGASSRRCGSPAAIRSHPARSDALLEAARAAAAAHPLAATTGATSPQPGVIVVRALAARVEPAMELLQRIWRAWRPLAWGVAATPPRVWST